jgi:hypothetical protein
MGRSNHRIVASSLAGRRMTAAKGTADRLAAHARIPADVQAHNDEIDRQRRQELAERKRRRQR